MLSKYVNITIGDFTVQVQNPEEIPIAINYSLEDPDNFQKKKSADSIGIKIPAVLINDKAANTFRNPDVMDLTNGQIFRGNQRAVIEANGLELLVGKAFLQQAVHNDKPKEYEFNLYGDNADWMVDLQEATMYDFLKHINFSFTKAFIMSTWGYDGTDPDLPLVFAPVRYRSPMGGYTMNAANEEVAIDDNVEPIYLRPSLSMYWILYWAFKSVGYRIRSNFFDSEYFRRSVMPWTWGNFLNSEGTRLNTHKFLAKSTKDFYFDSPDGSHSFIADLNVSNDNTAGAYDNNDDYSYNAGTKELRWEYKAPHYGTLEAVFSMQIQVDSTVAANSDSELRVQWYKNGVMFDGGYGPYNGNGNEVFSQGAPAVGRRDHIGIDPMFCNVTINPGDVLTAKFYVHTFCSRTGRANILANCLEFQLDYFKIPLGGAIDFANYTGLQKFKVLDYLRGVVDLYNISFNTDAANKEVVIEPTHPYSLSDDLTATVDGYFKNDFVDWNNKADLSKDWTMENYSDYERELILRFKEDNNDGLLKKIQDRNIIKLATAKYVFPARFKTGKKEVENRFFSPVMHYEADQWKYITGVSPQLIALIPENISNTSNSEASNTFVPKVAYYKGDVGGVGGWKFDGTEYATIPFMFAVNYKDGGQNDPVISYSDERISDGAGFVLGKGLLKRFYLQRLAIMRNGQWYSTWFKLKNIDVAGLHREYKSFKGHRWELIQIRDYKPLMEGSTSCLLRRWAPMEQVDGSSIYPGSDSVVNGTPNAADSFDVKYAQLKCLNSDIPKS